MRKNITILVVLLCAAMLFAGCSAPVVSGESQVAVPTVTVRGEGELTAVPDLAKMTLGVMTEAESAQQATDENAAAMARVFDALKACGIEEEDLRTQGYSLYPRMHYEKNKDVIVGYTAESMLQVTCRDVASVGEVLDAAFAAGANMTYGVSFSLSDPSSYDADLAALAAADAAVQAKAYAEALGLKLGDVLVVTTDDVADAPVLYVPENDMMADNSADAGAGTEIAAGTLKLSTSVTIKYRLDK